MQGSDTAPGLCTLSQGRDWGIRRVWLSYLVRSGAEWPNSHHFLICILCKWGQSMICLQAPGQWVVTMRKCIERPPLKGCGWRWDLPHGRPGASMSLQWLWPPMCFPRIQVLKRIPWWEFFLTLTLSSKTEYNICHFMPSTVLNLNSWNVVYYSYLLQWW